MTGASNGFSRSGTARLCVPCEVSHISRLKPTTIALMHGPTFKGDGEAALNGLTAYYQARLSSWAA